MHVTFDAVCASLRVRVMGTFGVKTNCKRSLLFQDRSHSKLLEPSKEAVSRAFPLGVLAIRRFPSTLTMRTPRL